MPPLKRTSSTTDHSNHVKGRRGWLPVKKRHRVTSRHPLRTLATEWSAEPSVRRTRSIEKARENLQPTSRLRERPTRAQLTARDSADAV